MVYIQTNKVTFEHVKVTTFHGFEKIDDLNIANVGKDIKLQL